MTKNIRIVIGGFLLSFSGGATYSWGVFTVPLMDLFGWNKYEANLSFTVFMLVFALAMLPAGILVDRFGYRLISRIGAFLFLPAYLLASLIEFIGHTWWLPVTHGLLGGIGCACVYSVIAPAIRENITKKSSLSISIAVMGFGLSSVFLAPIKASLLIPGLGVSGTLILIGLTVFLIAFSASFLMPPKTLIDKSAWKKSFQIVGKTIKDFRFYLVWIVFALSVIGGFLSIGIFPSYAKLEIGLDAIYAAVILSVFSAVNGFGRPFAGLLAEWAGFSPVLLISGCLQVLFLFLLIVLNPSSILLIVVSVVTGWSFAVILGLYPSFTASVLGNENLATRYGMVFSGFGLGSLAMTGGSKLYDMTGSFIPAFIGAVIASLLSVIFLLIMLKVIKK